MPKTTLFDQPKKNVILGRNLLFCLQGLGSSMATPFPPKRNLNENKINMQIENFRGITPFTQIYDNLKPRNNKKYDEGFIIYI